MSEFKVFYTGDYLDEHGQVPYGDIGRKHLTAAGLKYDFIKDQATSSAAMAEELYSLQITPKHLEGANGIIVFRPWVKPATFAHGADELVVIGRAGAGYDKIDVAACTDNDVLLFNTPDSLTHSTASSALLLILALAKRLPAQERMARSGSWEGQSEIMGDDLPGQTLGVVGLGKSGVELARLLAPFGMRIIAYSPSANAEQAKAVGVTLVPTLEELFRESDYISLHNRLDNRTRGMITAKELGWMKPTAYFVNVARGEIVDQAALIDCLRAGRIAGAGLDVFEDEPVPLSDPILQLDNVIVTPHWLPSTHQAAAMTMKQIADGMIAAASGKVPPNVVNPAVLDRPGFQAKLARWK